MKDKSRPRGFLGRLGGYVGEIGDRQQTRATSGSWTASDARENDKI